MNVYRFSAAALVAASLFSSTAFAQAPRPDAGTGASATGFASASKTVRDLRRSLLERRWDYSKENRAAAAAEYAAIRASGEATPADELIYGIVRFRQHEYAPAASLLNSALTAMPDDRLTQKTRIWTALERNELEAVWPLLSRLQRTVFVRAKDPAGSANALNEDLVFLGQLHGYLAGPYGELDNDRLLLSLRDEIAMNLPHEELSLFESAERSVEERQELLSQEREALQAEIEAEEKTAAEAKLAELAARQEDLKAEQAELDPAREKVVDGSRDSLNALTEAEALIGGSGQTLMRQAEALRIEYRGAMDALSQAYGLLQVIDEESAPSQQPTGGGSTRIGIGRISRWQVERQISQLRATLRALEQQMALLERDHAQLNFNFAQIRQLRVARETELQRNVARIAWDAAKIERELQLLKEQTKKVGSSGGSRSRDLRELDQELESLETYVDFSLEAPREAALAALKDR